MRASAVGAVDIIEALCDDPTIDLDACDKNGHSAHTVAVDAGQGHVVGLLRSVRARHRPAVDLPAASVRLDSSKRVVVNFSAAWPALAGGENLGAWENKRVPVITEEDEEGAESTASSDGHCLEEGGSVSSEPSPESLVV
eukprot:gnl/TRDRNA2_/TRDRNA2_89894_c2_seq1.p1 gnl/TRDRNA2_/TRDRNA2_89894_c2~~gnl/TRDRNA2_/TRDRNA2_89894_c2_seq1.p1  ORF type:complete len:148 (+),score=24.50 gnl/TRDRNA2_/TRDRNA2_89894_c2_seq1:25-444(+)